MNARERILVIREKAKMFLHLAYAFGNGDLGKDYYFWVVATPLGFTEEECDQIEAYLSRQSLIIRQTLGGMRGIFSLTYAGLCQVEEEILAGEIAVAVNQKGEVVQPSSKQRSQIKKLVRERHRKLSEFLNSLYLRTSGDLGATVTFRGIVEEMNLTGEELDYIEHHLSEGQLIKRLTTAPLDGYLMITRSGIEKVEASLLGHDPKSTRHKKITREPNGNTKRAIKNVAEYRKANISNNQVQVTRETAYGVFEIDSRTVRRHAPELHENWNDVTYDWQNLANW